ncbi:FIST signal transduction protein [Kineosporia sp. R_H_3]|uniref:FIST signal transduction protein n=1 Tax=Kineosporia sp. R_H_3 TaxID=1961848 RepID=UPI000B4AB992|nr:FIST N-terminal domain-containing protein [Kineosporia sp. R_H_3]
MNSAPTASGLARGHATGPAAVAVADLVAAVRAGLRGADPAAVLYFASSRYDPQDVVGPMADAFPGAAVVGCSKAGEFTDAVSSVGGISAVALPRAVVGGAVATLGDLSGDVHAGIAAAIAAVETTVRVPLRDLDPAEHVGFVLIDGMHQAEEAVNEALGDAAPLLDIVGGSAGDDLAFERTWVAAGRAWSFQGVALMVCHVEVPFRVVKTCAVRETGITLRITSTDETRRVVTSFDGRPAAQVYAEAVGVPVEALCGSVFMRHPLGQIISGEPWVRSPSAVVAGGGVRFLAQMPLGMDVAVLGTGDLVGGTRDALLDAWRSLGTASGAVMFNCILRRLEMDATGAAQDFVDAFGGLPVAGFHTYGETWMAHVNQTLTGILFG